MQETGFWNTYEQWQRDLVAHVEAFREQHPNARIELWSFSLFNDITREPWPAEGDTTSEMAHFVDPAHYRTSVGEKVLATLAGGKDAPGFGVRLASDMLADHQARLRRDRDAWRADNPEAVAAISRNSEAGLAWRQAHGIQCPQ
jgi:hypothetical protein